jgi:hypothetical protein
MWTEAVRRWVERPQDVITWTLSKLPREQWPYVSSANGEHVAVGPAGIFCLHEAAELPEIPGPHTHRVHAQTRRISDELLAETGQRVWPNVVGVLPGDSLDDGRMRFGVHYVCGDHLLRWLLTRPAGVEPAARVRWADVLSAVRQSA